jgi:hypothetical protein
MIQSNIFEVLIFEKRKKCKVIENMMEEEQGKIRLCAKSQIRNVQVQLNQFKKWTCFDQEIFY